MQLKTPSAPSTAGEIVPGSVTSPCASFTSAGRALPAAAGSRTSATTSSPRSTSRRATALPTFPVAPVTMSRIAAAYLASSAPPAAIIADVSARLKQRAFRGAEREHH